MKTDKKHNKSSWQTPGQKGAKHLLDNFVNAANFDSIPHAFLFLGPRGVGKESLAVEFAKKISEFNSSSQTRAEILEFDFEESGGVENLRELISFSSLTTSGAKKIFILKNFELASPSSSNILLKTLEEPAASSMFILIANGQRVLPTIMSRCVAIRCFPLDQVGIDESLLDFDLPGNLLEIVKHYPGLGQQLQSDPERTQRLSDVLSKLGSHQLNLIDLNSLTQLETEDLQMLVSLWIISLKAQLDQPGNLPEIIHNLKVAQNFHEDLKRSYNSKLVLQQFLMNTK
ncbi:hypothetical protein IPM19_03350 [bacterium]|nr:MAG: hypothetical protein IPM19_03350 [bacterium]